MSLRVPFFLCLFASSLLASDIPLENPDFENGTAGWDIQNDNGMSAVLPAAAQTGLAGLRITDSSPKLGASVESARWAAEPGGAYRLKFQGRVPSGSGIAVYFRFYDRNGKYLNPTPKYKDFVPLQSKGTWQEWRLEAVAPENTTQGSIYIHSYDAGKVTAEFDEFRVEKYELVAEPPWKSEYKIRPTETERLTDSDLPGPDGIVYPDWRWAGVTGGIPDAPLVVAPTFFRGLEEKDISGRLNEAVKLASAHAGGGAIGLPEGRFFLDHSIIIGHDSIVIRGAGLDKTHLIFRDRIPLGELRFFNWAGAGSSIGFDTTVEIQANPKNLTALRVEAKGEVIAEATRKMHWGNRFSIRLQGTNLMAKLGPGLHQLKATATYADGKVFSKNFGVDLVQQEMPCVLPGQDAAFIFAGQGPAGAQIPLVADGLRGGKKLRLPADHGLHPGERIVLEAPATETWNKLVGNFAPWGRFRVGQYRIAEVAGDTVTLDQALRVPFPASDGSYVQRIHSIARSGIEDLTIEQAVLTTTLDGTRNADTGWYAMEDLWTDGVTFNYAWDCWIRHVRVINSGRNPLYLTNSKFCQIENAECDGALFKGGGGTGYVGLETSFDCLVDSITTKKLRHAPDLQWGSAGNVVRCSKFLGSDAQFHAGWTNENLLENNVIESNEEDQANGSYGFGIFASGPSNTAHGPEGPRNVIYHNQISSAKDGLRMLGGNENWIIDYNLFSLKNGHAIYGEQESFDHIIKNNVFVIEYPADPAILFHSPDCTGIEILGNIFYGPIVDIAGFENRVGKYAAVDGNSTRPLVEAPSRADAPVPSIYLWEKQLPSKSAP